MTPDQIAELEALAAYVVRLPSGVERANAKAELALFVTHNLPAILAALKAQQPDDAMVERVARRKFPILGSRGASIDWQLVEDHGRQVMGNHRQTVARLAERGGLSWCELHAVLHNRKWQKMDENEAILACRAIEARHRAALKGQP